MLADDIAYLLGDLGSSLTLTRPGAQTYDPSTGTMVSSTNGPEEVEFTIRAVFINYVDGNVDGSVVRMGDRRLLVDVLASTTAPQIDDVVQGLRVIDVRTIAPNGTPIAYSCQMRK